MLVNEFGQNIAFASEDKTPEIAVNDTEDQEEQVAYQAWWVISHDRSSGFSIYISQNRKAQQGCPVNVFYISISN